MSKTKKENVSHEIVATETATEKSNVNNANNLSKGFRTLKTFDEYGVQYRIEGATFVGLSVTEIPNIVQLKKLSKMYPIVQFTISLNGTLHTFTEIE